MGYRTKIQKVERPTNQSFYVNLPSAVAQALNIEKGEEFDWLIEDKNTLVLSRVKPQKQRPLKKRKS
jgi:antitoxin component of MazEF toxin-antitoxin module